jgi:4-diphosphocytidyl-2-C-methyl-D-erythritol kinase
MLTLISPAKINLFLRIIRRRPDNYHDLASLFQAISLHDTITFQLAETDLLKCSASNVPTDHSNLIWKAINLYRKKSGRHINLQINLQKQIPTEAGLGGGSSNAATALWAINTLIGSPYPESTLIEWAGEIGSDVAFFFSSGSAYCTGRGEIVTPLPPLPMQDLQIAKPHYGLSTPKVYGNLNLSKTPQRDPRKALESFTNERPEYFNDLEETALCLQPELKLLKSELQQDGFQTVLLSGSGTAFACFGKGMINRPELFHCHARYINRTPGVWYEVN